MHALWLDVRLHWFQNDGRWMPCGTGIRISLRRLGTSPGSRLDRLEFGRIFGVTVGGTDVCEVVFRPCGADTVVMRRHSAGGRAAEQTDKLGEAIYSGSFLQPMPRSFLCRREVADFSRGSDCH